MNKCRLLCCVKEAPLRKGFSSSNKPQLLQSIQERESFLSTDSVTVATFTLVHFEGNIK